MAADATNLKDPASDVKSEEKDNGSTKSGKHVQFDDVSDGETHGITPSPTKRTPATPYPRLMQLSPSPAEEHDPATEAPLLSPERAENQHKHDSIKDRLSKRLLSISFPIWRSSNSTSQPGTSVTDTPNQRDECQSNVHAMLKELKSPPPSQMHIKGSDAKGPIELPKWSKTSQQTVKNNVAKLLDIANPPVTARTLKRRRNSHDSDNTAAKRHKSNTGTPITSVDVQDLPPPIRISYQPHPPEDRDDGWFKALFKRLFTDTVAFVEEYFLFSGDLPSTEEPWALKHRPEFVSWAQQVATDDPVCGGWENLLRKKSERKWLLVAILVGIFKSKLFDEELFGADEEEENLLDAMERSMLSREGNLLTLYSSQHSTYHLSGFHRTALRAEIVRSILGTRPVTRNFYTSVATLNARVFLLFLPLTTYLSRFSPLPGKKAPSPANQYQSLHNLLSSAAYLSIAVRTSPTIFFWVNVSPNEFYERDEHISVDTPAYVRSKEAAMNAYNTNTLAWDEAKRNLDEAIRGKSGRALARAHVRRREHEEQKPKYPEEEFRCMAKVAAWPSIKRFKPGSGKDDEREKERAGGESRVPLQSKDGFREFEISRAAVLCYYGRVEGSSVELGEYVKRKQSRRGEREPWKLPTVENKSQALGVLGVAGMGLLGYAFKYQILEHTGFDVDMYFGPAVKFMNGLLLH